MAALLFAVALDSGIKAQKVYQMCIRDSLYIWDEPLNYIDIFSRMQIEKLIRIFEPTMLFVEHDARFVKDAATRIVKFETLR